MMKTLDVSMLFASKDRPWFEVFHLDVDRKTGSMWFHSDPHVEWVDGLGDADYWGVEFDCGLCLIFEFVHAASGAMIFASEPVPPHVQRHLKHWNDGLHAYPPDTFGRARTHLIRQFSANMPELLKLQSYQLWRQGDDGNPMKVGCPTSERDATCWQVELESHGHKQIYWVAPIAAECDQVMHEKPEP